jgi:muramoyltetrapeptide carboxypeptidase
LKATLAGRPLELKLRAGQVLFPGRAAGRLVGGNLAVIAHLAGTPFAPDLRGAILFIEEVGEETYRVDRMLIQLRSAGMLRGIRGVVAGCFAVPARRRFPPDRSLDAVFREAFGPLGVPVVTDVPAGHLRAKRTLPLGAAVDLDTDARRVRLVP